MAGTARTTSACVGYRGGETAPVVRGRAPGPLLLAAAAVRACSMPPRCIEQPGGSHDDQEAVHPWRRRAGSCGSARHSRGFRRRGTCRAADSGHRGVSGKHHVGGGRHRVRRERRQVAGLPRPAGGRYGHGVDQAGHRRHQAGLRRAGGRRERHALALQQPARRSAGISPHRHQRAACLRSPQWRAERQLGVPGRRHVQRHRHRCRWLGLCHGHDGHAGAAPAQGRQGAGGLVRARRVRPGGRCTGRHRGRRWPGDRQCTDDRQVLRGRSAQGWQGRQGDRAQAQQAGDASGRHGGRVAG
jgi:hypothetical protein